MKAKIRDKYLLYKVRKGDSEAFGKIYNIYVDKIYRFVFLKTSSKEESEDITGQTFYKVVEYISDSEKQIENLQAFLYRVARNLVADFYKKANIQTLEMTPKIEETLPDEQVIPEKRIDQKLELEKVKLALKELNDDYKDAIILYYIEELPVREMAQIMDRTEGAVRVLIHRALEALRDKVQ